MQQRRRLPRHRARRGGGERFRAPPGSGEEEALARRGAGQPRPGERAGAAGAGAAAQEARGGGGGGAAASAPVAPGQERPSRSPVEVVKHLDDEAHEVEVEAGGRGRGRQRQVQKDVPPRRVAGGQRRRRRRGRCGGLPRGLYLGVPPRALELLEVALAVDLALAVPGADGVSEEARHGRAREEREKMRGKGGNLI